MKTNVVKNDIRESTSFWAVCETTLKFRTKVFYAKFCANSNDWLVETDEFLFTVRNVTVKGYVGSLKQNYQILLGRNVNFEFKRDWITILKSDSLHTESLYKDLYNPDMPRNLAKVITV